MQFSEAVTAFQQLAQALTKSEAEYCHLILLHLSMPSSNIEYSTCSTARLKLHLLFPTRILLPDTLPSPQTIRISFYGVHWTADCPISVTQKQLIKSGILTQIQQDVAYYMRSAQHSAQTLECLLAVILRSLAELSTSFQQSDSFNCAKFCSMLHKLLEKHDVLTTKFDANERGVVSLPSCPISRSELRKLFRQICMMLLLEKNYPISMFTHCTLSRNKYRLLMPLSLLDTTSHIGFTAPYGVLQHWGGWNSIQRRSSYGCRLAITNPSSGSFSPSNLLSNSIPDTVTVPLLAYSLFSAIQFLIPNYPSRLSPQEPFHIILQKQKKKFFLSLNSPIAQELADAYCGVFSHYSTADAILDEKRSAALQRIYDRCVHDGVVIVETPPKKLEALKNGLLIQDAQLLCLNPSFLPCDQEVRLHWPSGDSSHLSQIRSHVDIAINQWISFAQDFFSNTISSACQALLPQLHNTYKEYTNTLRHKKGLKNIPFSVPPSDQVIPKKIGSFYHAEQVIKEIALQIHAALLNSGCSLTYQEELHISYYSKKHILEFRKVLHQAKTEYQRNCFPIKQFCKELRLSDTRGVNSIYCYLYGVMRLYLLMLKQMGYPHEEVETFSTRVKTALQLWAHSGQSTERPFQTLLTEYLTNRLCGGRIIAVRTARQDSTIGWYDPKKSEIYLDYCRYFEDFCSFHQTTYQKPYTGEKKHFQSLAIQLNLMASKNNGTPGTYLRPDFSIVVDAPSAEKLPKVRVVKIELSKLHFDSKTTQKLHQLSQIPVIRRSGASGPRKKRIPSSKPTE